MINICRDTNYSQWDDLFSQLPDDLRSPFFCREYYESFKTINKSSFECVCAAKDEENFLIYPFVRGSINQLGYELTSEYYDVQGAYGYNGILGMCSDPEFLDKFNSNLIDYIIESNIIAEFVRYCPMTDNRRLHLYTNQIDVLDNVYIDLTQSIDDIWQKSFEYGVRKAVKKSQDYNLRVMFHSGDEVTEDLLQKSYDIYIGTMQRNNAAEFYHFSIDFFRQLCSNMKNMLLLVTTWCEDQMISTEWIFLEGALAFGFLGGTHSQYYHTKANSYQKYEMLKHLKNSKISYYSMGGGASRNDSIYNYKKSFAQNTGNTFYIGTKIHNPIMHAAIKEQWRLKFPNSAKLHSNKILCYREMDE